MPEVRSDDGYKASPNDIKHRERKRAAGPGFNPRDLNLDGDDKLAAIQTSAPGPSGDDVASTAAAVVRLHESRWGHKIVEYGCYAGALAVAFTYANGFYHLMKKNQQGWANTFRHRMFILSPVLSLYACGNGVIPMPFRRHIENAVGRPSLSTMDLMGARDYLKKQASAANSP